MSAVAGPQVSAKLEVIAQEAHAMLRQLEDSYWGTEPRLRGRLVGEGVSLPLRELVQGMELAARPPEAAAGS